MNLPCCSREVGPGGWEMFKRWDREGGEGVLVCFKKVFISKKVAWFKITNSTIWIFIHIEGSKPLATTLFCTAKCSCLLHHPLHGCLALHSELLHLSMPQQPFLSFFFLDRTCVGGSSSWNLQIENTRKNCRDGGSKVWSFLCFTFHFAERNLSLLQTGNNSPPPKKELS